MLTINVSFHDNIAVSYQKIAISPNTGCQNSDFDECSIMYMFVSCARLQHYPDACWIPIRLVNIKTRDLHISQYLMIISDLRNILRYLNMSTLSFRNIWSQNNNYSSYYDDTRGPFYWHGLTVIPAWISNLMPSNVRIKLLINSQMSRAVAL